MQANPRKGFYSGTLSREQRSGNLGHGRRKCILPGPRNCFEIFFTVRIKQPWISPDSLLPTNMRRR